MSLRRGDFATLNDIVCVVVGVEGDCYVPEEHVALWYGDFNENGEPEVWTVPAEYVIAFDKTPAYRH